jgi:hypothetical protein
MFHLVGALESMYIVPNEEERYDEKAPNGSSKSPVYLIVLSNLSL